MGFLDSRVAEVNGEQEISRRFSFDASKEVLYSSLEVLVFLVPR